MVALSRTAVVLRVLMERVPTYQRKLKFTHHTLGSRDKVQIVAGRYSDGWKARDLGDHLGMTPSAVRQALMRIREQLKQCIELRMAEG